MTEDVSLQYTIDSGLFFSVLDSVTAQLSHCLTWGNVFRASWHNLCLSGKESASSSKFGTELNTHCNLGDNPNSPQGNPRGNSFLQSPRESIFLWWEGTAPSHPLGWCYRIKMPLFLPHKPLHVLKFKADYVLLSVLIWSLLPRDGFVVLNLMEIFSTLRKQCQLEYSLSVCPASSIFHFLSKILLATASAAETHTLMQMRNDADWALADWSCRFEDKEQNWRLQKMRFVSSRCQSGHHLST